MNTKGLDINFMKMILSFPYREMLIKLPTTTIHSVYQEETKTKTYSKQNNTIEILYTKRRALVMFHTPLESL